MPELQTLRSMQSSGDMDYMGAIHSVHRLDRVTSGLVAFAKDAEAGKILSTAFQDRQVSKYVTSEIRKRVIALK